MANLAVGAPQAPPMIASAWLRGASSVLLVAAAAIGIVFLALSYLAPAALAAAADAPVSSPIFASVYGVGALLMLAGGVLAWRRPGMGGAIGLTGALLWLLALLLDHNFRLSGGVPAVLGLLGGLTGMLANERTASARDPRLIFRQAVLTRVTHWAWAIAMFFLLLSGLQIFNARPDLYIGHQSGFGFENGILHISAENTPNGARGYAIVFGQKFDTTGVFGMSGSATRPDFTAFPGVVTIPSTRDLATGRVVHFFFAWILVGALAIWLISSLANRHFWRDIVLKPRDIRGLWRDVVDHIRFRFHHTRTYSPLQKLAYFGVFVVAFPLIILTGLTMSPGMDTAWPWLLDLFGGRQTARTIHFFTMMALVLFFVVHIIMVVLAGPINELRSMITGYYRISPNQKSDDALKLVDGQER